MIGETVSHYRITRQLGAGGMGVVYEAVDTKLDRTVALKFLPPESTRDSEAKARFIHEAKAASALDHPNVCNIHEIDETNDGQLFIAMACYTGQTLKEKISRGPLPLDEAIDITRQVAQGLQVAHQNKIIHRDIKPANIFLTDTGLAKILDFGLAKLAGVTQLTQTGTALGTAHYLSPEQARGEEVDHRTDLWSLGVTLYEMTAGEPPFKGDHPQAVVYAILNLEPDPLPISRSGLSMSLWPFLRKALAKGRELRHENVEGFLADLQQFATAPAQTDPARKSIVVLPFENISPDRENEYFADGLTEEITADLAKVRSLRVISRTSAMRLKGRGKDLGSISRELGTQYVLEGSVRRAGDDLRITAQLIDALSDSHLWSEKYTGTVDDVFNIQEKVARSIVDALRLELTPEESRVIGERPIMNVLAYECYLRARREMYSLTESGFDRALRELKNGLEIMGENAQLYFGVAEVYLNYYEFGINPHEVALAEAEKYAAKVRELDPESASTHYLIGMLTRLRGRVLVGARYLERAYALDPDSPNVLIWLGFCYACEIGNNAAAMGIFEKLLEIDPLTPSTYFCLGIGHWLGGRLDRALESFEKNLVLEPEATIARAWIAVLLLWRNERERAFGIIDDLTTRDRPDRILGWFSELLLFLRYGVEGKKKEAQEALSDDVRKYLWADPDLPWLVGGVYSVMGEKEEALRWLGNAIDHGWINYPLFTKQDPFYENLREDDRFKNLMAKIKPQWEDFQVNVFPDLARRP